MTSTPRRSQASSIGLLKGLCALLMALKPASLRSSTRRSSARPMVAAPSRPLSWCTQAPRSRTGSPLMRRPRIGSTVRDRMPKVVDSSSSTSPPSRRVGPAGVERRIVGTPAPRSSDDEPLAGRQDIARRRRHRRLGSGDNRGRPRRGPPRADGARGPGGLVPHLGADTPPRPRRRRSPAWSAAGRPAPGAPVPRAARRCGRSPPPNTTGCRRGRGPRP